MLKRSVHGHIECIWSAKSGQWSTPVFVDGSSISVNCLAPGLNYGQQAYEGLKGSQSSSYQAMLTQHQPSAATMAKYESSASINMPNASSTLAKQCPCRFSQSHSSQNASSKPSSATQPSCLQSAALRRFTFVLSCSDRVVSSMSCLPTK